MIDEEKIIIDGVNVSKCEYVCNTAFGNIGCKLPFNEEIHCCNIPNCYYKQLQRKEQECEELKKQLMQKSERLCYLNAEKSFRIVDLEQTLDEIEKELKEDIYCESQECGCDDFEECLKCTKEHILDIINEAKENNQ